MERIEIPALGMRRGQKAGDSPAGAREACSPHDPASGIGKQQQGFSGLLEVTLFGIVWLVPCDPNGFTASSFPGFQTALPKPMLRSGNKSQPAFLTLLA